MQGWRKRMEDAHILELDIGPQKDTQLFGIFDGHGGPEVAQFVGKHFTEEFVKNAKFLTDPKTALEETFLKMDEIMLEEPGRLELIELFKKSKEDGKKIKENSKNAQIESLREAIDPKEQPDAQISLFTGCTANVLVIRGGILYFANAGDSRSVLCKRGQCYQMSMDHKPTLENELKRIERAGGWVSEGRLLGNINLSRGLGDSEYKMDPNLKPSEQILSAFPEVRSEALADDCDFAIVACDGIWECKKEDQEICDYFIDKLKKNPTQKLSKFIEELLDEFCAPDVYTEHGVGCDNMSCIVIQFKKKKQ